MIPKNVLDPVLYRAVKREAKKRFKSWPSAYGSGWLVQEYKRRGGRYAGAKSSDGLERWFAEEWIDMCYYPDQIVPCGRPVGGYGETVRAYPYCRPLKRRSPKTPKTAAQLTEAERKARCKAKRNPYK